MKNIKVMYSVYLSNLAIELRLGEDSEFGEARFICSQINYRNILEFAMNLAKYKKLPFWNYVRPENQN
ncbi:MAG: hypothetical protein HC769_23310 [Cyanobacteria bacterium CRU_2_1]|nr:hypothetical protein [Cyanobacteria bacterium CRU_2_1]